jgi:hypothetical protein
MSASANSKLPAKRMGQPTQGDGYMAVARELLPGVKALSTLPNVPSRAAALIAAHALECALKAFLWHKGKDSEILAGKVKHDLLKLWDMAFKEGLGISQAPPDWCRILSLGHGPSFYFRYQEGARNGKQKTIVHGGSTPALEPMAVALRKLIETVERTVKS